MSTLNQVIMYGTAADIPAASIPGRLYFATDTDIVYYDTGSTWENVASSGFDNPMTASGDLIVGGAVSDGIAAPARLAAGTSGFVLTSNGAATAPSWQAGGGGGGGSFPNPTTVTAADAVSEIDLTGAITSGYRDYEVRFSHITMVSGSDAPLFIQFSADDGATWDTADNYYYGRYGVQMAGGGYSGFAEEQNSGGIMATLLTSDSFNAGFIIEAKLRLNFPMNVADAVKMGSLTTQLFQNTTNIYHCEGGFYYANAAAVNAVRLYSPTGTFTGQATIQPLPQ